MKSTWSPFTELIRRAWFGPLLLAIVATVMVSAALDPAGDYPSSLEGPGLTIDEIFNVDTGVRIADRVLVGDVPGTIRAGQTLPDHPPLGRLWLGLFHEAVLLVAPPRGEHSPLVIAAARFGSAVAFGILVWWIGWIATQWFGNGAGWAASGAVILMPRVFAHAHLASLETVLNLSYCIAVLIVASRWSSDQVPNWRTAGVCGIWFGLALLTKIQAILVPIPVVIWALVNWKHRALLPLFIWGAVGLVVFFVGWPWLWLDPPGHLLQYLGHAADRSSIQVWYLGRALADRDVPWHYPWVIFATTIPIGLQILGIVGVLDALLFKPAPVAGLKVDRRYLLLGSIVFPLLVFTLPGVAVYDGERLFLMIFPLCAIWIGHGAATLSRFLGRWLPASVACSTITLLLVLQSIGLWQYAPCWLSYYNVAGEKLDLQPTYWGDSVTRELWTQTANAVPANSTIDVAPVLHQFQLVACESQCPAIRQRGLKLRSYQRESPAEYLIVFFRREYLPADWRLEPTGYRRIAVTERHGVILAGLYQRTGVP